jgi:PurA ssDNA and RNA-binding protein
MDTQLRNAHIRIERKRFTFDLKENLQGAFLRITEEVNSGRRNSIVIPLSGLELFRDTLNEIIGFDKTSVGIPTVIPLGQPIVATPAPDGSADVRIGS